MGTSRLGGTFNDIGTESFGFVFSVGSVTNDGKGPAGILIVGQDNNLYGATDGGGSAGWGTIYKSSP